MAYQNVTPDGQIECSNNTPDRELSQQLSYYTNTRYSLYSRLLLE